MSDVRPLTDEDVVLAAEIERMFVDFDIKAQKVCSEAFARNTARPKEALKVGVLPGGRKAKD